MATKATMEDIARECGVTKMTVSRVIAGKKNVKQSTRMKILEVASQLNYEINTLAQNLNLNRSGFIGIATPFEGLLGSPYFAEVCRGFESILKNSDQDLALFNTHSESFNDGAKLASLYRQRRVDGLLVVAAHTNDYFVSTLHDLRIPMVVVGEQLPANNVCSVTCHDAKGIELLCNHLYDFGHRNIAFVEGPHDLLTAIRRRKAFVDFCEKRQLVIPSAFIQPGDYTMRSGRIAGNHLLTGSVRPTAIVAANDMMAFGVIEAARSLGMNIPGDVSVAGFDDLPSATDRFPSLTTIHQPVCEMGEVGAKILLDAIQRGNIPSGQTTLDVSLVLRESTRPLQPRR